MKRKFFIIFLVLVLLSLSAFTGCSPQENEPDTPNELNESNEPGENIVEEPEDPSASGPQNGGILRCIRGTFPKVLGYAPEFGPSDGTFAQPYAEMLLKWVDGSDELTGELAKSWEEDPENLTITYYLQEGVQFHDGTPFNAEAVKWNFEQGLDTHTLTDGNYVESLEVVDEYTFRIHITEYTNQLVFNFGWNYIFSPTAFEKAGDGDIEKSIEWARTHAVGTGPFKLVEFQRDNIIRYEKNENYWREDMPYLDGIEIRFIPDNMTAKATMQAKEADVWLEVSNVEHVKELESLGYKVNWGPGMLMSLFPSTRKPDSIWNDLRVREALEYAIDREALADMIGLGAYEAVHQLAVSDWPGYVPGYNPRPFNPERAKELLAEAGYPDGFETTILVAETADLRNTATAIQGYLKAVGIDARVDIADMGRYYSQAFAEGWDELLLALSGINPDASDLFVHFAHDPMTFRTGDIYKSPEYLNLCQQAIQASDRSDFISYIQQAVQQAGEDAMLVPLFRNRQACVMADYVHTNYMFSHAAIWNTYEDWMDKH